MDKTDNIEKASSEDELLERMFRLAERMEPKMSRQHRVNMLAALLYSVALISGGKLKPGKVLTLEDMLQNLTHILGTGGFEAEFYTYKKENA